MTPVAYLHLPRFPLQRLVLEQPSLSGKPLVLLEDVRGVERVRFVSSAASKAGARAGQTGAAASATVPALQKRRFEADDERKALGTLGEALMVLAPGFQVDAPDGLWLDASAAHLSGGEAGWLEEVLARVAVAGFRARVVMGHERFTTQAVCRYFTQHPSLSLSPRGGHALASMPLDALACAGLGVDVLGPLRALGLSTLGEVAGLPIGALAARFGSHGHLAAQLARGEDASRLVPDPLPEVLHEAVALDWPAEQLEPVLFALKMAVDRLCARLQGRQLAAVRLSVGLALEGAPVTALPLVLARPASHSKILLELIRHRLTDLSVHHPIAGVSVIVEEACLDPGRQLMLGDLPGGDAQLEVVLSRLQSALGEASLFSAEPTATHRPEEGWRHAPFRPPDAGRPSALWGAVDAGWALGAPKGPAPTPTSEERRATNAQLSLLTPSRSAAPVASLPVTPKSSAEPQWTGPTGKAAPGPNEADVQDVMAGLPTEDEGWRTAGAKPVAEPTFSPTTMEARPVRLFQKPSLLHTDVTPTGLFANVTLQGRRRRVESLEGPERLAGQWWSEDSVARDYYRVQLEGVGLLWVFRDGRDGRFYAQGVFD